MVLTRTKIAKKLALVIVACLMINMMPANVNAAGEDGFNYVAELLAKTIYQCDPGADPNCTLFLTSATADPGIIAHDWNVAGTVICVADMNGGVTRYDTTGTLLDHNYTGVAWGIAVDGDDNVWVAQREAVVKFNSDLSTQLGSFDLGIVGNGLFEGMSYDPSSNHLFVAVTDGGDGWREFDTDGNLIFKHGGPLGNIRMQVGPDGRLYGGVGGGPPKNKIFVYERDAIEGWKVSDYIETTDEQNSLTWDNDGNMYGAQFHVNKVSMWDPPQNDNSLELLYVARTGAAGIRFKGSKLPVPGMCIAPPLGDIDGDCIVDLSEVGILSAGWMACGLQTCP